MKKILHISETFEGGGAEAVFRDTLKISEKLGFTNEYFVSDGNVSAISYVFSFAQYFRLKKELTNYLPDVIHIHNYYHYLTPSILKAIEKYKNENKCKVIFTAHDYHLICPNSGLQYFENHHRYSFDSKKDSVTYGKKFDHRSWAHSTLKLLQFTLSYRFLKLQNIFDVIVSPSNFLRETFINYGVRNEIRVIRNPANFKQIEINKEKKTKKDINDIDLVFIGRLSPEKGLLEFIDNINNKCTLSINLHIYGKGILEKDIDLKSRELRVGFNIIKHGFVDSSTILDVLTQYDIFVLPSVWYENAPLSIIEASIAGLPVVIPNSGGLLEMAQLTKHFFPYEYDEENFDTIMQKAFLFKGENGVLNEKLFSEDTYQKEILRLYTE